MDIAVYLFTGFLEAGKSTFIKETMDDARFTNAERTLLLLCEEGEVEFDGEKMAEKEVYIEIIDDIEDINTKKLSTLCKSIRQTGLL